MSKAFEKMGGQCVLCGKTREQVKKLILGVHGGVCLDCVDLCNDIIRSEQAEKAQSRTVPTPRPAPTPGGKRLEGRVAIVTGASRGIGAAIAKRLAADGAKVVVNYNSNKAAAQEVVDEIREIGGAAILAQGNVAETNDMIGLIATTRLEYGRLDILVNNAGVAEFLPLEQITATHFVTQFNVNVGGVLAATKEAVKYFDESGGRIINITSGAAQAAPPGTAVYSASKAAVEAMTKSFAAELGPRNITVNAVAPGLTATDMLNAVMPAEVQQALIANTPLRRLGTPEDIADVVAFLASDDARWITGQILAASGGFR